MKKFVILSVCISLIHRWDRMRKVSKDVEDVVVSKLCHSSSTRVVARELGFSQSCILRIKQQCLSSLKCPIQGRPKILSSRQDRACVHAMTVGGKENASEAEKELRESEGVNVSRWTVRRALKRARLSSRVKHKKPKLSSKHIRDCLDFAKTYQNWSISDWERVIFFSHERRINCFKSNGRSWCWVRDG